MSHLDTKEAFSHFRDRTLEGIQSHFPLKGKFQTLELDKLEVKDDLHPDDIRGQHKAKLSGESFAVPIYGHMRLIDNATGNVVDQRKIRLAELPKTTQRYSYILNGREYQFDNQWQLKPGAYTRRRQNGELETRFNVVGKSAFDMVFDPGSKQFHVEYNKAKLPVYPLLKTLGVDDDTLERHLGRETLEANKSARGLPGTLEKFYKTERRVEAPSRADAEKHFIETMQASKMRPEATALTLGKPLDHVNGEAMLLAAKKLMQVQGGHPEDDRDSLVFKDLRSGGDYVYDKMRGAAKAVSLKAGRKINTAKKVSDVIGFDMFNEPVKQAFNKNSACNPATQINPVEMIAKSQQTTIMGPGGIKSEQQVMQEAKFVNPSHLGFLDPINTPEGCFDSETEVFTAGGWKYWPEVVAEDVFACRVDGRLEFHKAEELQAYRYKGTMYGMRKPWLEYLVTPNHRVLCRPYASPGDSELRVERADYVHGRPRLFPIAHAPLKGGSGEYFVLPFVAGNNSSKNVSFVDYKDWAAFMGWFLSEGSFTYDEESSSYHVKLFQSWPVNAENCTQIEALLRRLPFAWSYKEREHGRVVFTIGVKQLAHYVKQFGKSHEKWIPYDFFEASVEVREALLETLMLGDGRQTRTHKNSRQSSETYTTTSRRLALDVERLAISLGRATSVKVRKDKREDRYRDVYEVCFLRDKERSALPKAGHYYTVEYDGMVYCATVPGSFLYVRRAGKHPMWSGNSKTGVSLRLPVGVKKVGTQPMIPLYNLKTGTTEDVPPGTFFTSKVVLPDQVTWKDGKPHAIGTSVKMAGHGNEIIEGKMSDAQYAMRHPSQLFDMTSNLVPYLGNSNGNRAGMAVRHMEQSISLLHREAPLVQVATGADKSGMRSFEEVVGSYASHSTPVAGTVHKIKDDGVTIRTADGHEHEVQIYNNYPLNDAKSSLHSTPVVKVGDKVKAGQLVADTNYSKNGSIALGTNLRVAYMPFKGYNFEDGVVISETAAKKLSSTHLYKPNLSVEGGVKLSKKTFLIEQPGIYKEEQYKHIGDDGLPKIGSKVKPGDPLILAVKPFSLKDRTGEAAIRKSLTGAHTDRSLKWDGETEGEVVGIAHNKDGVHVHVRTVEPMQVGDKMAGRYGNKGIVTMVLPDKEMPHTKDGKHIEVALNPSGVPGRMNVGQVLETAISKVALKTGQPVIVPSFTKDGDMLAHVQAELKKHNISDTEELHDPGTGHSLGQTLVGYQHIIKLVHQVDKKVAVSSGMPAPHNPATYDINLQPKHGQRIGSLGLYAMLAHGAKANLREMQTWKGEGPDDASKPESKRWPSQHGEVWKAIQTGSPLPAPKSTFAFKKFEDLLKGSGVNIEKQGHEFMVSPLTDRHVLAMTEGRALPKAGERLEAKIDKKTGDLKARTGGLFDEKLTGGHGGQKWSRIDLAEPIPNPVFERPILALTGLSGKDYAAIVAGEKGVHANGQVDSIGKGVVTGGAAIKQLLQGIDVKKDLAKSKSLLTKAKASEVDKLVKKVKYLDALDKLDMKPSEAYVLHHVPVIPPAMRPASPMADGNVKYADINQLYSDFAQVNEQLRDPVISRNLTDEGKKELRRNLYDGMKAITGYGVPYGQAEHKGLLHQLSGASPKTGFFQNVLAQKRQDLTMRSTIVPEPALGLDEMGLPKHHAIDLFRPFVVKKLQEMGAAPTPLDAQKMLLKADNPYVHRALEKVMEERPVMLKRDPVLHKYGIQGFNSKIVEGNAIKIHPLVVGGFNADFDGDTMSVFVPISKEAVAEVHKMKPSQNIFAESSGKVTYVPSLESALGAYKLSLVGKQTDKSFKNPGEILNAVKSGSLLRTDVVSLNGKKTTAGRVLLATTLPEAMQHNVLHNLDQIIDKKGLNELATVLAKNHKGEFDKSINKLKDLGNHAAFGIIPIPTGDTGTANITDPKKNVYVPIGTHTLSLKDFTTDTKMRDEVLGKAHDEVGKIKSMKLNPAEQHRRVVDVYMKADQRMHDLHDEKMKNDPSNLYMMHTAGMKPEWAQYKQMVIAPMLVQDSANRTIATPVDKSYSEGLDIAGYWTQMHGARRGTVMRVQETSGPGALSKLLMASTMDMQISNHDCGTTRGILMGVGEKDVHDRVLAQDYRHGDAHLAAGTMITPDVIGKIRAADKNAKLLVRSPLKCEHDHGLCQKCVGLSSSGDYHPLGTNIGVIATQTIGERAVQLPMKAFHTGGVVEQGGGKAVDKFSRLEQLTLLPKKVPNSATVAMRSGKIDKIEPTSTGVHVSIGGARHFVGKDIAGNVLHKPLGTSDWSGLHVGMHVNAGDSLSDPGRTVINPHDLYSATGSIDAVQNHLANEIYDVYRDEGIKRRHVETVVKAMSNLTKIVHPGDSEGILRGEFQPLSVIQKKNSDLVKQGLRPIEHTPSLKGVNMLPLSLQEDWMAKLQHQKLKTTISDAAAVSAVSRLHGHHPIPGLVFGAEFGVTSEKSNLPGYGHLKNVPVHNY